MGLSLAVLSDIHGNRWALEAVLADIAKRGLRDIVHLGDVAWGVLDPSGTVDLLRQSGAVCIAGNQDREVLDPALLSESSFSLRFTRGHLSADQLAWLATMPSITTLGDDILLCHGTPTSDVTYLLEEVTPQGAQSRDEHSIASLLGSSYFPFTLCGHTHVPRRVALGDGRTIVNPGSVGLPAYSDDTPYWHAMESGSPHANYAVLNRTDAEVQVDLLDIPYDWETAAETAARNGRPDWAYQLLYGRVER